MTLFIAALMLLSQLSLAAPAAMEAERQQAQYLIEQAYQQHPAIPAGFLETQAWVATRWQHRIPTIAEEPGRMPPVYGLFGLYGTSEHGFVDLLGDVSSASGLSREELLASQATYIEAVAAFIEKAIIANGLEGQPLAAMRPIVELMSGISPRSEAARYAVNSHVYEVYRVAGTGVDSGAVSFKPQAIDLREIFSTEELEQLAAPQLVFDDAGNAVDVTAPKKKVLSQPLVQARLLSR